MEDVRSWQIASDKNSDLRPNDLMTVIARPRRKISKIKLARGNQKLGDEFIWSWSLPAGKTCPGETDLCAERCYAARGFFLMPSIISLYDRNWKQSKRKDFVKRMIEVIKAKGVLVLRIHVSGDYYSREYAEKWLAIMQACPECKFFCYSRSWRVLDIRSVLLQMTDLPNVQVWWSVDKETGVPEGMPTKSRSAYMMIDSTDIPTWYKKPDLIFRDYPLRGDVMKNVNGVMVCPTENGVTHTTCEKCGICWNDPSTDNHKRTTDRAFSQSLRPAGRLALPLA